MEKFKIREDLNDIVSDIQLCIVKTRKFSRPVCIVKLFNGTIIEFNDRDGVGELFNVYKQNGINDALESKKLIECFVHETKGDETSAITGTYICVAYKFKGMDYTYKMLPSKGTAEGIINVYYDVFKKNKKAVKEV